ncbi:MAG: hypothetical protein ACYS7Y_11910 [Planctomycetota bacterium]
MNEEPTIPCEICGTPTPMWGTKRCNGCWEVETRLAAYLKNPKGLDFARKLMPQVNDWVDGKCDAWDYEAVLAEHDITVEQHVCGWSMGWEHGTIGISAPEENIARQCAALFVELWLRNISASFASKIVDSFGIGVKFQEEGNWKFLFPRCKTCAWYKDNRPDETSHHSCLCPKMVYGYGLWIEEQDRSDSLMVEDDEGWGIVPGPEFGCIHHKRAE